MDNIDWNAAPKDAVKLVQRDDEVCFMDSEDRVLYRGNWSKPTKSLWTTIATRPTDHRKTIEGAVDFFNEEWPSNNFTLLGWHNEHGYLLSTDKFITGGSKICTREEFETYVAEKAKPN